MDTITTRAVGVSFRNSDESSRQELIDSLEQGERIYFKREPKNKFDKNAVAIFNKKKKQLGYINKNLAIGLTRILKGGYGKYIARAENITYSEEDINLTAGFTVHITFQK